MEFMLVRFTQNQMLLRLQAGVFSLIYLVSMLENLIIISLTILSQHLHTPVQFFLRHLSFLDLCLISTTVPKFIFSCITFTESISYLECVLQLFLLVLMAGSETGILSVMSYDCYVAICCPLHYEAVMIKRTFVQLMAVSWFNGGSLGILYSTRTFSLNFCGSNKIHQFFCDVLALLKLTCSQEHTTVTVSVPIGVCYAFSCLVCIVLSYVYIFSTLLRIRTRVNQSKAFATCLRHLIVVSAFLLMGAVAYLKPPSNNPSLLDLLMSVFYSVVPPILNPVIYCLKNKDIKSALVKSCGMLEAVE